MIVFFDIDGTIISDDEKHIVPDSAVNAIRAARKNGHLMYINTGRTIMNVEQTLRDIGFDGYVCGCGTYIECGGEVLLNRTVPKDICHDMARLIYECDMSPVYERSDSFFIDKRARELGGFAALRALFKTQGKEFSRDIRDADFGFDKLVAWYDEKSDLEKFKRGTEKEFDYIDRGYGFCELAVKGFSKGTGIDMVCTHYGIPVSNAIAIGDSLNDLPMLSAVPNSVAMGKSAEGLKKMSVFVTKDLYDNGIEYALKHFNLI
ncbi:MAG: HAD-IIB family hydrolase [Oscillospiraceae bacterium]|nr:HAD-IIB family hydrolase [Oscillospiraceae bacterium]